MGDIPERGTFRQPVLRKALEGYFEIVKGEFEHGTLDFNFAYNVLCSGAHGLPVPVPDHTPDIQRYLYRR